MRHLACLALLLTAGACSPQETPAGSPAAATAATVRQLTTEDLYRRGYERLYAGLLDEAMADAREGLTRTGQAARSPESWRFRVLQAEIHEFRRQHREALAILSAPAPEGTSAEARVRAVMTEGLARCRLARDAAEYDAAQSLLARAERLAVSASDLLGWVELLRGTCAQEHRRLDAAETHHRRSLALSRATGSLLLEANASGNLGFTRLQAERYDDAADWFRRTAALAERLGNERIVVKTIGNLALCDLLLGRPERVLASLERATGVAARRGYWDDLIRLRVTAFQAYGNLEQYDLAAAALREAEELSDRKAEGDMATEIANHRGGLALLRGFLDEAEEHARHGLERGRATGDVVAQHHATLILARAASARGETGRATALFREVALSRTADLYQRWEARAGLAKALAARHLDTAAEAEFARAFATIEVGRAQLKQDESRLGFVATLRRFYDDYVGFIVQRGRVRTALEVADRSRARLLTERLGRDPLTQLVSATDLQQLARQLEATLVSYWLAPEQSYAWIVSADSIELHRLPERAELCRRVDAYQAWINGSRDPIHEESAAGQDLYADLLGPLAGRGARGSRVVLALDECLHHLNFESLVVPKPVPHYWLDDVRVEIAPALGLLAESVSGVRARKDLGLLAFGDPLASGDEFPRLPQAAREIAGITHAFPPEATAVYTGADANPGAWRAAHPERFAYIHFAAHATANRDSPLDSAIVLSPKGDDYKLYARDILDIPLHAELVTLSACRSAGARAYAGEGLVGLAWAFLSAGAQRVVGGLWNVEDASTAQLMERMYRGLRAGQSPAEALRAAKLELLHSDTAYRKPFYWAPFVVYTRTGQN